jgi:SAM-dependent methyltransferase
MTDVVGTVPARETMMERLFASFLGGMDMLAIYLGDRLGLYAALALGDPKTPSELADATGIHERYAREWLEQQAVTGILAVEGEDAPAGARRYSLPAEYRAILLDERSLDFMAPLAQALVACARPVDAVMNAFRSGGGVPFADYGSDLHEAQARLTRPMFDALLAEEWLGSIPDVRERLESDPPARVVDVACGLGRSSIAIARGYPKVHVDGIDLDEASIARAGDLLSGSGLENRVTFAVRDAAGMRQSDRYDLALIFEALHDMTRPVAVLRAVRALLGPGGSVIIGDERTADHFSPDAGDVERMLYGFSVMHCLPAGMVGEAPAGTGTVMRTETVERYARDAGFGHFEVLPIENDVYRFYRLRP